MEKNKRCAAALANGNQCANSVPEGNDKFCWSHQTYPKTTTLHENPEEFIEVEDETIEPEEFAEVTVEAEPKPKKKKKTTKPWNSVENPWSKNKFSLFGKHKGFHPRFISQSKIHIRLQEGWVQANGKHYGEPTGIVSRMGMTLMELPNELLALRKEHFDDLINQRNLSARDVQISEQLKGAVHLTGQ